MKQDIWLISGGMLVVGIIAWTIWGNPHSASRQQIAYELKADPALKLVSERSPYMRAER